jgi:hypothetical protein
MTKKMENCCGTCAYHIPVQMNEFVCDNEESENYGCETGYDDCCIDHEERECNE